MEPTEEQIILAYRLWMMDYLKQAETMQDGRTYPKPPLNMFRKNKELLNVYLAKLKPEQR